MKILVVLCFCEIAVARIVDLSDAEHKCGVEASSNQIHRNPWMVLLEFNRKGSPLDFRCGATLISSRHLLTAAHCVKRVTKRIRVVARLGEFDLNSEVDCVNSTCAELPIKTDIAKVIPHPQYDGKEHDIAILVLAHEAPYIDTIRPVCLPTGVIEDNAIFTASGWGEDPAIGMYSHIKKNIHLPFWSPEKCQSAYHNLQLPKLVICAGGERGIDTCRGDSGGPLTLGKGRSELWGVTSSGNVVCGTKGSPGIYTSVIDHLKWIEEIVNDIE